MNIILNPEYLQSHYFLPSFQEAFFKYSNWDWNGKCLLVNKWRFIKYDHICGRNEHAILKQGKIILSLWNLVFWYKEYMFHVLYNIFVSLNIWQTQTHTKSLLILIYHLADLATYDTVKHVLLNNTSLQDNWILHGLSRWVNLYEVYA